MVDADLFVFLDHIQHSPQRWTHRTRMADGEWLTVPLVRKSDRRPIREVEVALDDRWKKKARKRVDYLYSDIKDIYLGRKKFVLSYLEQNWKLLLNMNMCLIDFIRFNMDIDTKCVFSSGLKLSGAGGEELIREILLNVGATGYIVGQGHELYGNADFLDGLDIETIDADYSDERPILDLLFNGENVNRNIY